MEQDKFTNIYRLPTAVQIRIGKWQQTFNGTSDLVMHQAIEVRNKQYRKPNFFPSGWSVQLFDNNDISITNHGKYIQTAMRTMMDRKVSYKRIYLSRLPLEEAEPGMIAFKQEWNSKHTRVARQYTQIKNTQVIGFALEEAEQRYPSLENVACVCTIWNKVAGWE